MLKIAMKDFQVNTKLNIFVKLLLYSFTSAETRPPKSKMECVAQYTLFGCVMSLQSINLANSPRDALLLGFKDAKLSVVEYDPETHDLKTLSLHYFEEEDMKVHKYIQFFCYLQE